MAPDRPYVGPWWQERFDELDRYTDEVCDSRDDPQSSMFEVELEPLIDSQWDELDGH